MEEVKVKENSTGVADHNQGVRDRLQKMSVSFVTKPNIRGFNVKPTKRSNKIRINELMC